MASAIQRVDRWADNNRPVAVGLALVLFALSFAAFSQTVDVPGLPFSQVDDPAALSVERQSGSNIFGLQSFKTVGTGADTVTFEATIENTGDVENEFELSANFISAETNKGEATLSMEGGGTTPVLTPGDVRTVNTDSFVLAPGESATREMTVNLETGVDGDVWTVESVVQANGQAVSDIKTDKVKVESGQTSLSITVAGTAFAALGAAMMLAAL